MSVDDRVDDVKVVKGVFDDGGVDEAASISFARCSTFGCKTNQLQICNWLVIAPNREGISSSSSRGYTVNKNKMILFIIMLGLYGQ